MRRSATLSARARPGRPRERPAAAPPPRPPSRSPRRPRGRRRRRAAGRRRSGRRPRPSTSTEARLTRCATTLTHPRTVGSAFVDQRALTVAVVEDRVHARPRAKRVHQLVVAVEQDLEVVAAETHEPSRRRARSVRIRTRCSVPISLPRNASFLRSPNARRSTLRSWIVSGPTLGLSLEATVLGTVAVAEDVKVGERRMFDETKASPRTLHRSPRETRR